MTTHEQALEVAQLQSALKALSEKLKLFQNIDNERENIMERLESSEKSRDDLQQVIRETADKTKTEFAKTQQYEEILLRENQSLTTRVCELECELKQQAKNFELYSKTDSQKDKQIEALSLQITNLKSLEERYEESHFRISELQENVEELQIAVDEAVQQTIDRVEEVNSQKEVLVQ